MTTSARFSVPLQDEPKCNKGTPAILVSGSGDRGREPTDDEILEHWNVLCGPNEWTSWCDKMRSMICHFREGGGREPSPADVTDAKPQPEPCPRGADKPEETCTNRHQCWEPCGELGNDERYVRVAPEKDTAAINKAIGLKGDTGISGEGGEE